ncbi:MFS transporter [Pinibacter aurantiacus]|uniref:MFS transporter n=1 Tax=Pinibacter aurantiacus TaxID=2851599 RepID=A0A9E2S9M0_9BACT|nr:MFS transporter [Pinibacter aurantiacus]MBV4358122.1 MFS transporter [Pinibacter aurantiacus]
MQTASKKVINGWAMYDWANSVYNLVITTTFFPIYFTSVTDEHVTFLGRTFVNSSLYDYTLSVAYLFIALLYPILTSIADTKGNKINFMKFFCYMGSIGCACLYFFTKDNLWFGIICFMLAAMGYVGSLVFYNAYLPEIAAPEDQDRVSAKGFSMGYIGSVLLQLIGFALVMMMKGNEGFATRITFLLVGIWWISFAQITFSALPKVNKESVKKINIFTDGFNEVKKVYGEIKKMPVLKRFLRGFFFYSMGVQTVMLAATLFGSKLLGLPAPKLIATIVIIQLVAIPGAIMMSRLSAVYGNIKVLMGVVFFWIGICVAAYYTAEFKEGGGNPEYGFYGLAVAVGLVMGGIQSLSRSTYSKLMPETKDTASYFSYYDLTEKIAIVIGMFSFGFIDEVFGMKNSVLALTVFFVIGLVWLYSALKASNVNRQSSIVNG